MALPGIIPRLKALGNSGFSWLAYLMAYLYAAVRLLPADHAYLQSANIGRYGVRHVIAEAASRLVFKRENADQIAMFFLLLMGFVLLIMQFVILIAGLVFTPALASGADAYQGFFKTLNPENDIALMLLDKIFAIPGLFESKYAPASAGDIPAFNGALHKLFEYYSLLMLIVAVLIFLYYILVVVAETAMSGTPFGRRFSHIYAPIRLVIAIGLLVPVNYGLNSAQYITLFAAKYGSGLATNAWILFNSSLSDSAAETKTGGEGGNPHELIARPTIPDVSSVATFMSLVQACKQAYEISYYSRPYSSSTPDLKPDIKPYLVRPGKPGMEAKVGNYEEALKFFDYQDVFITFGHKDEDVFTSERGNVYPYCGEIRVQTNDVTLIGSMQIQTHYYDLVLKLFDGKEMGKPLKEMGERAVHVYLKQLPWTKRKDPASIQVTHDENPNPTLPVADFARNVTMEVIENTKQAIFAARDDMLKKPEEFELEKELIDRGWGGAAIWYNRIAMWNGAFIGAAQNYPSVSKMPYIMDKVKDERMASDKNIDSLYIYEPKISGKSDTEISKDEGDIASMLSAIYVYWNQNSPTAQIETTASSNSLKDGINFLFGAGGLMEMRENADIHPLAQLAALGKGMIEASIRNMIAGISVSAISGASSMFDKHIGEGFAAISRIFMTLTSVGLTVGFILFYVMPFLPFIYFFFAVSAWVKSIFEAMVGVPLWALAHLKIDGHGIPGDQAMNGYFLIFEIFIRPILTLFGLLASIVIFSALAKSLNELFPLVVNNLTGFAQNYDASKADGGGAAAAANPVGEFKRGVIDEFFFTVIYTIFIYLIGTSSFKLIDLIPGNILRWMGAGVQTFSDSRDDPTGNIVRYAAIGGSQMTEEITGAISQGAQVGGKIVGAPLAAIANRINASGASTTGANTANSAAQATPGQPTPGQPTPGQPLPGQGGAPMSQGGGSPLPTSGPSSPSGAAPQTTPGGFKPNGPTIGKPD